MGAKQSKISEASVQAQLVDRLRALELEKNTIEKSEGLAQDSAPPAYAELSRDVSINTAEQWEKELLSDSKNRLAMAAFTSNAARDIIKSRSAIIADQQVYNTAIPVEGSPVTNQRASGRCWLFASTNVFRVPLMKKYDLKEFQLSQAYLFFWDKLEKANLFLENILDTVDEPLDSRLIQSLMSAPVNDGGQWDMVANLVEKYGLVPQTLYPDAFNASNSSVMGRLLTTKLREDALRLRSLAKSAKSDSANLQATKYHMMREIHLILTLMLGPPPAPHKPFTWQYYDSKGNFHSLTTTPVKYAASIASTDIVKATGADVLKFFSLVHDPRNKYNTLLTVDRLGNVSSGRPVTYVNVEVSVLKATAISMIKKGIPVFFGSDVGQYSNREGIMDLNLFDYSLGFNVKLGMTKAERLSTGESAMTHAMVLTAVHIEEDGSISRWRVENSWSEEAGEKGYFVMTDVSFRLPLRLITADIA